MAKNSAIDAVSQDKPVIALDLETIPLKQAQTLRQTLSDKYQLIDIPKSDERRPGPKYFGENLLEELKALKYQQDIPVVGVITLKGLSESRFMLSGIEVFHADDNPTRFDEEANTLQAYFTDYQMDMQKPDAELNGMTQSEEIGGNSIRFINDNSDALAKYLHEIETS